MKKAKAKARRGVGLGGLIRGLMSEWGFTALMVLAMGIGVGVVLWVAFGASFLLAVGVGIAFSTAAAIVMWFAT